MLAILRWGTGSTRYGETDAFLRTVTVPGLLVGGELRSVVDAVVLVRSGVIECAISTPYAAQSLPGAM